MREQGIKRYKRRKQMAYKVFCWILGILVALIGVSVVGFWVVIFMTFC
nr:MAG TPA: Membrane bound YbgT-like protein [Caudoviricetes sp.]